MCTVTVIAAAGNQPRWRLACNRDEQRTRPPAQPPTVQVFATRRALLPIDPVSGGTWIAVNDAAVAMTLLNVNLPAAAPFAGRRSRGMIIPSLLHCSSALQGSIEAGRIDPVRFAPFRLIIVDDEKVADVRSDGAALNVERFDRDDTRRTALMYTSSGLGDHLVEPPRRRLFEQMFVTNQTDDAIVQQDAFHRHCWPNEPHLSVCMSRADARTVSFTVIERCASNVKMTYYPDAPNQPADPVESLLPFDGEVAGR